VDPTWASRVLAGTCTRCARKNASTISVELLVERDAVEARRICAEFGHGLYRRPANQEGEVPGVRHHVILVLFRKVSVHGGNALGCYDYMWQASSASFRRPKLNRYLDRRKAVGGKENPCRVSDYGGLDPRLRRERPRPELSF
jgi:hypothetical protein